VGYSRLRLSGILGQKELMSWMFISISAHLCWALANLGDKYLVSKRIRNPYVYVLWLYQLSVVPVVVLIPFVDFFVPSGASLVWLMAAGILWAFSGMPYIKAMQIEEPSRINMYWSLIPVFILLFSTLFLGERFTHVQLFAFVLLVFGSVIASVHAKGKGLSFSRAAKLMIIATLGFSIQITIMDYVFATVPFLVGFIWFSLFGAVAASVIALSPWIRSEYVRELKRMSGIVKIGLPTVVLIDLSGTALSQLAISLGPAALVLAFEGSQILFVFLISTFLSLFYPHIIKEDLDKRNVFLKLTALIFVIAGTFVLAFSGV